MENTRTEAPQPVWRFLAGLQKMDLKIWSEEGRLRVSAPAGVLTSELREELSVRKAEVLDFLHRTHAANGHMAVPLKPAPRDQPLPLSFAQQRLWMLEQMNPGKSGYHVGLRLRLEGVLSIPALRAAIANLVRRHESLRTTFPMTADGLVQEIANDGEPELELLGFDPEGTWEGGEEGALANAAEEGQRPYDLANGPLIRWRLYRIGGRSHLLWAGMHHIVTDGWSLAIMYRELAELYQAAVAGREASLGPLTIQYPDFAAWQREWLSGEVLEKQLGYWRNQLTGAARTEVPADRSSSPESDIRGVGVPISLSPKVLIELKRLAKAERATLFMTLLAGLQALLHRYTGQDDIVVGSPIANRNRSEVEGIVGFFVNALVLRTDLSGNPGFRELLRRAKEVTLKAYEFQDMPFEKLVEDLAPERTWGQNPFIEVIISLQNLPLRQTVDAAGLKMSLVETKALTRRFELEFHLWEADGGLSGQVVYNPDRFDAGTVERYIAHYCRLLEGAAKDPDRSVSELPMLDTRERSQLLVEWNQTTTTYPREEYLPAIFDRWAEGRPQAVALTSGERTVTYAELRDRSNEFAHYLQARGVGEGSRVGVCMGRSPEMICAVLGILRAGAAYVPLDPDYPPDRLHYMVKDAGAKIVVTMEPFREAINNSGAEVISWRRDWSGGAEPGRQGFTHRWQRSQTIACILYTSGSTGTPKGVALLHRGIVRLVLNTNYLKLGPDDRMAHLSNVCFDAATFEIWGALLNGSRLVVIPKSAVLDPGLFVEELRRARISTLLVTTALFNELTLANPRIFEGVEQVFFGGEAADAQRLRRVLKGGGAPGRLVNLYGPTECTTVATFCPITHVPEGAWTVPIGRPISNTRVYVLDRYRHPVPVGVPGELYVGGDGVAQGYLNQPQLTAEKFVADPFNAGSKLYRTGDIVKYLADGNIEFIGRADSQIKMRGFRIEPGEIEAALKQHCRAEDAVVLAREDESGRRRLVAYIVPKKDGESTTDWGAVLRRHLPDHLVPSAFVVLEKLRLTDNGKVDRRALPAPERQTEAFRAPRTPQEQVLCEIFAELLSAERVGIDDNFFELGGHSLLAMQLIGRLRSALGAELPVRAVFEAPSVAGLASQLQQTESVRPGLIRGERPERLPLSYSQEGLWFLYCLDSGTNGYNMREALRLRGSMDIAALERAVNGLVERHESLRTRFDEVDGESFQIIDPQLQILVPIDDLSALDESAREEAVIAALRRECEHPFNLRTGPLLRTRILKLAEDDHIFVWVCHHIVSDGWSVAIFKRDLSFLYKSLVQKVGNGLEPLGIQFPDYALWQRRWLAGERLDALLSYWKKVLDQAPVLDLPTDAPRPERQSFSGGRHSFRLSSELCGQLAQFNRQEQVTPFMSLLAAYEALLSRYSGQEDFLIGMPVANRGDFETEHIIGLFVNALVVRADLSGAPNFRELVARVKAKALDAFQHQDLPFERLVQELCPQRDLSRHPLFQATFALQNAPEHPLILPGVEVSSHPIASSSTRFDLELHLRWAGDECVGVFFYNRDLFDSATVERMAGHFEVLLRGLLRVPDCPVARVPMLTESEIQQVVRDWNQTVAPYPAERCVHQEFARHARLQPDAPAVVSEDKLLSYGELDDRSERLADYLRGEGVGVGSRVALCMDRSMEMIVGMLAILKAGGVYVPLDPAYPAERLAFLLKEIAAPVILTAGKAEASLPVSGAKVLCLERDWPLIAEHGVRVPRGNELPSTVTSGDLAYVIFTSGSTGTPKGVAVPHRAIMRLVLNSNYLELGPGSRVAHLSNVCFDAATFEIWGALLNYACVVIVSKAVALNPERFAAELERRKVSALFVTTALFNELAAANGRIFQSVKQVLFGGEAVSVESVRRVLESRGAPGRLLHVYGPTECTTFATFHLVTHLEEDATTVPIGRPISNTTAYVLDRYLNPVPVGVPGELYLGGPGVARGYLNEPELTRERFVVDPFAADESERLYRTGDIVKYRPDGNIEFIGRIDNQVKIRGFRIEPGEIEAILNRHSEVENALVVVREDTPGERQLVAYLVHGANGRATNWRSFLKGKLPSYMIPTAFVVLEKLPLTPNGKVDRRALPAPERSVEVYRGPRTPQEEILCEIFGDLLSVERVGIDDDFFELGGHSLLALQMVMTLRNILHVEIPVTAVFEHPTILDLGRHLDEVVARNLATVRPPIERASRDQPLPLSFAQQRLWRNEGAAADSSNLNVMAFTIEGELDVSCLERSLQELEGRHEIFRSTFHVVDGQPVQRVAPEGDFRLGSLDLSETPDPEAETRRLLMAEKISGVNLERGPLMRALVLRWARDHYKVVLTLHHIVYDGWSLPIFFHELHALYAALSAGQGSPLPALSVQQADFAVWQRAYLDPRSTTYQTHLAFWLKQLSGNPILKLPCERPKPLPTASMDDVIARFEMSEALSTAIRELSRQEGVTLFMTFLAALKALINLLTGQNELMLGTYMANRSAPGSENMMGYFCDLGLLRTTLSSDLSFLEALRRVRETVLDAHAHEDMPFEVLGEEMEKRGYGWPAVRALFMMGTSSTKTFPLGDLEARLYPGGNTRTMMPWNFQLGVHDGGRTFSGRAKFDACQHDPHLVRRMVRNYVRLLEAVVTNPTGRLSDLEEKLLGR